MATQLVSSKTNEIILHAQQDDRHRRQEQFKHLTFYKSSSQESIHQWCGKHTPAEENCIVQLLIVHQTIMPEPTMHLRWPPQPDYKIFSHLHHRVVSHVHHRVVGTRNTFQDRLKNWIIVTIRQSFSFYGSQSVGHNSFGGRMTLSQGLLRTIRNIRYLHSDS